MWLRLPSSISASSADAEDSTLLSNSQCQQLVASATWRTMPRSPAFWRLAWKRGALKTLRSGVMPEPSQASSSVTAWLESLGASRAPITRSRGKGRASSASMGNSGKRSEESFATFDPDGSFWRTFLESLFHTASQGGDGILSDESGRGISFLPDSGLYLETWPRSGSMRNGSVSRRRMWVPRIRENGGSVWPTIRGHEVGGYQNQRDGSQVQTVTGVAERWPTPNSSEVDRGSNRRYIYGDNRTGRMLSTESENWPTPRSEDSESCGASRLWTTPQDYRSEQGGAAITQHMEEHSPNLSKQVVYQTYPTPSASTATIQDMEQARFAGSDPRRPKYSDCSRQDQETPKPGETSSPNVPTLPRRLNPAFTSNLMGLMWWWTRTEPISCAPQEMQSYLCAQRRLLRSFFEE